MLFPRNIGAAFLVAGITILSIRSEEARAGWPPLETDDLSNPMNWPNDPDYAGRWNYWSFLPKQQTGAPALTSADVMLGASGMSVDKAWTLTVGRPDVKIAILDSGIKWDSPDLVNKVALNMGELATHKPMNAQNQACGGAGMLAGFDCNGDGVFNVSDYRDDPRFTGVAMPPVKCLPSMDIKMPSMNDRLNGDLNNNCILDPGDLITMFSDKNDDDGNGYTDDIAGWDFFRNDNDPYDDTRYGHGTGEAGDSSNEGNNGMGGIGTCPKCSFIPLRVGESFITDVNEFAKAVVYAVDNKVKVIQEALGTVDNSTFSRAAIDYAYANGVTVDASMADENSRHHNAPATWNHTLPVHTVRYDGPRYDFSSTYVAFDSCTNFGGHAALSVSGTSCASEATGRMAGILGLVYSEGLTVQPQILLTAEEVMQIMKQSADDINVAESRNPDPDLRTFYESKPGWDQRFNYGRANAYKAVKMVQQGKIPPEVEIVSPIWYQPIHEGRVNGPVEIKGRIAATRANTYDYVVEWAPGVEPDDSEFKSLASMNGLTAMTVTGSNGPLATFDPSLLDTSHMPDPDSIPHCNRDKSFCWGPNDKTVTLRVRAVAHYGGGDVKGDARRTISITNKKNGLDVDLLPGFPMDMGTSVESSPKIADIDGDGVNDLVFPTSDGALHVFSLKGGGTPTELTGFPWHTAIIDGLNPDIAQIEPTVPSYLNAPAYKAGKNGGIDPQIARESVLNSPAIGDLDGDKKPEIVISTWDGTTYVLDHTGKMLTGWPKRLPLVPSCPLDPAAPKPMGDCMDLYHAWSRGTYASPVLADLDKDGKPEIIVAAFDANVYVYKADGSSLAGFPVRIHHPAAEQADRTITTPAIGDLNGDGIPDIVVGSNETVGGGDNAGPMFAIDGRGMAAPGGTPYLPNWPITRTSVKLFPVVAKGLNASPAIADFDGDGKPDVVIQGNLAPPLVVKADPGKQASFTADPPNQLPGWKDPATGSSSAGFAPTSVFGDKSLAHSPDTMLPVFSQPAVGDMDQDGVPDFVTSGASLSLAGALAGGGKKPSQEPQMLLAAWSGKSGAMLPGAPMQLEDFTFFNNPVVADLDGDDFPEAIIGSGGYFLHAANGCGNQPAGWPKFTNGWIITTSAVGDLLGDGALEVVSATRTGYLFVWKTKGKSSGVVQWESLHHDNANTGNFMVPLTQGKLKAAPMALTCPDPQMMMPPEKVSAAGCTCSQASDRRPEGSILLGLATLLLLRRKRR
jgi:hypothetical protein